MKTDFKICIVLIIVLLIFYYLQDKQYEHFSSDNINNNVNFYVITLKNPDRIENINLQNTKLNANIIMTDAVNGIKLNQNELLQIGELSPVFFNNNELKRNKDLS